MNGDFWNFLGFVIVYKSGHHNFGILHKKKLQNGYKILDYSKEKKKNFFTN